MAGRYAETWHRACLEFQGAQVEYHRAVTRTIEAWSSMPQCTAKFWSYQILSAGAWARELSALQPPH